MAPVPDELFLIGHIVAPFGLNGQVKLRALTDRADHIEQHVDVLYIGPRFTPYRKRELMEHKPGIFLLTLEGVHSREEADALRRCEVLIHERDAAPLESDEYFLHELYGLQVETPEGEYLGKVREVLETGANDVLLVARQEQPDILIPMIREVVQRLDIAAGRVVVRLVEGLLPEPRAASSSPRRRGGRKQAAVSPSDTPGRSSKQP
jgi:16S rRNA processing protein RimM